MGQPVNSEYGGVIETGQERDLGRKMKRIGWTEGEGNIPDDERFSASRWNEKISTGLS